MHHSQSQPQLPSSSSSRQYPPPVQSSSSAIQSNGLPESPELTPEEIMEMEQQKVTKALIDYVDKFKFPYINDVSCYEKLQKIGQGTFGEVFKARCKKTGQLVALKKILMENEKEGFPITALREVKMLQQLKHANITELIEVCSSKATAHNRDRSTFYLVFTFCAHDLAGLLSNPKVHIHLVHIKTLMKHLLEGLYKIHRSKILHRDMKAANVLLTRDGILKLADFGLARPFFLGTVGGMRPSYTNRVVTLWYRPPELLLGDRQYTTTIDVWGAGCIMAELWTRNPIMQGDSEQKQLTMITNLCGSICPEVWPKVVDLPLYRKMFGDTTERKPRILLKRMSQYTKDQHALGLLDSLLALDPLKRLSSLEAIDHAFFYSEPLPKEDVKDMMDTIDGSLFEYTAGRGAHANRGRAMAQGQQRPQPQRNTAAIQPGQYHDMVF